MNGQDFPEELREDLNRLGQEFILSSERIARIQLSETAQRLIVVFGDVSEDSEGETAKHTVRVQLEHEFDALVITWKGNFGGDQKKTRSFVKALLEKAVSELPD